MFVVSWIEAAEVEFNDELLVNWFCKNDVVNAPMHSIRQDNPINALVRRVIDGLLYMLLFQFETDRLYLDERLHRPSSFVAKSQYVLRMAYSAVTSEYLS